MADLLTKSIAVTGKWDEFRKALNMVKTEIKEDRKSLSRMQQLAEVAAVLCKVAVLKKISATVRMATAVGLSAITAVMGMEDGRS